MPKLSFLQILLILFSIISSILGFKYLQYEVPYQLWRGDFLIYYSAVESYFKSGVLYIDGYQNFPLTAMLQMLPYISFTFSVASWIKFAVTLGLMGCAVELMRRIIGIQLLKNQITLFILLIMLCSFFPLQLYVLSYYLELLCLLLFSLYFYENDKVIFSALFLSLAIVLRIFLLPMLIVPLLIKDYKLFSYTIAFLVMMVLLSVMIFGIETHVIGLNAIVSESMLFRINMIKIPILSGIHAGYLDILNKLVQIGWLSTSIVSWLAFIVGLTYLFVMTTIAGIIWRTAHKIQVQKERKQIYQHAFSSFLILSIGFDFRIDFGVLLFASIPFLINIRHITTQKIMAYSIGIASLNQLGIHKIFTYFNLENLGLKFVLIFDIISFQFIGINMFLGALLYYWMSSLNSNHGDSNHTDQPLQSVI